MVALLEAHGFAELRQRGSHKQFRHPDGRTTTVPFHAGRDISPTLLRKIAADIHLTVDEFMGAMTLPPPNKRIKLARQGAPARWSCGAGSLSAVR